MYASTMNEHVRILTSQTALAVADSRIAAMESKQQETEQTLLKLEETTLLCSSLTGNIILYSLFS